MSSEMIKAFEIGANSKVGDASTLISALIYGTLLFCIAYICLQAFEELKNNKLSIPKLGWLVLRGVLLILIVGYFLLRH